MIYKISSVRVQTCVHVPPLFLPAGEFGEDKSVQGPSLPRLERSGGKLQVSLPNRALFLKRHCLCDGDTCPSPLQLLDVDPQDQAEEEGGHMDLDAQRKGKCAVIKTSTRQVHCTV